jgi:hypothetical protein
MSHRCTFDIAPNSRRIVSFTHFAEWGPLGIPPLFSCPAHYRGNPRMPINKKHLYHDYSLGPGDTYGQDVLTSPTLLVSFWPRSDISWPISLCYPRPDAPILEPISSATPTTINKTEGSGKPERSYIRISTWGYTRIICRKVVSHMLVTLSQSGLKRDAVQRSRANKIAE